MDVVLKSTAPAGIEADVLAVPLLEDEGLTKAGSELDSSLDGLLERLVREGELRGEAGTASVVHVDDMPFRRVVAAGLGEPEWLDADSFRTAASAVAHQVRGFAETVAWTLDPSLPVPLAEQARAVVEGMLLGDYDQARWKHDEPRSKLAQLTILAPDKAKGLKKLVERSAVVTGWVNRARDLVNSPPNETNPEALAARAAEIAAAQEHVEAMALGPKEIEKLGMGAFRAVSQGSDTEPRLIVLRYEPPRPRKKGLVLGLVGKAITFDTGGISLKPALRMEDMKGDMAGGAAVIEATGAIADLGLPIRVLTVVASCENMPGGHAYRPGDILTAMNGKTIEVTNTDAEGRLVLADALWYARQNGATHLLDLATLTGAMEIALGDLYAGIFANDDAWRDEVVAAGEASGDHAWGFPMHPRYRRYVDSSFADLKNSSDLRQAGAVYAAEFLKEFAGEGPWAHADIAGPAFLERSRGDYLSQRGGTGYGVRLIVELASRLT
ncbi:MAG TPA: leucyl aminopeptidase [Gaiellaceae bacterium]|nr:leucyl aminopeptidase [Gaiellaceae bacterium]